MKNRLFGLGLIIFAGLSLALAAQNPGEAQQKREQLYRLNNLGVAYLEQFKHEEAAKQFKQALAGDPNFALARINLALANFYLNDSRSAIDEARAAIKLAPDSLHAHYVLAAALRNEKLYDEAIAEFNKVLAGDSKDPAANIQVGQIYSQKQQYEPAVTAFRKALDAEPFNATAAYSLAQALIRSGNPAEGQKMLARFQQLRASGYATTLGNVYGEKGRYAEAVVSAGLEPDLISKEPAKVTYAPAKMGIDFKTNSKPLTSVIGRKLARSEFNDQLKAELVSAFGAALGLADLDGDNRLDLLASGIGGDGKSFIKVFHNEGGKFSDATERSKINAGGPISGEVFGDFDNDGKTDLALFGYRTLALWRNNGDGSFSDVTEKSGLPAKYPDWAMTAAWVDADHDGDLDLFIGNFADLSKWPGAAESAVFPDDFPGEENKLYRNNGNGTFTDITAQAGLSGGKNKTTAVVCTDFNNQRDIDFLVVNYGAPVQLFSNQRDGSFKEMAAQAGFKDSAKAFGVGAGDLNKDGFIDFYLPRLGGKDTLYLSDGRGGWTGTEIENRDGNLAAQMLDYDNDGLLDVFTLNRNAHQTGVLMKRGMGNSLTDVGIAGTRWDFTTPHSFAVGDVNNDGTADFATISYEQQLEISLGQGAGKNFVALNLSGKTSNRSAIGAKAELRSGSLRQKLEVYSSSPAPAAAGLNYGLGFRASVDTLQLIWPAGILQSELTVKALAANPIEELDRKGTSCPILYAWNGNEYSFITDFLGGSAIGAREPGKTWNYPDANEYIRVTSDQLKARDGLYSLRINNQLEEVIYFDAVKLLAVDHPAETEIYPNERLMPAPPYPEFKIYSVKSPHPPISASDDRGRDILPLIKDIDRRYPDSFENLKFKGYAKEHAITLDLGRIKNAKRVLLLMTAWIDYADSTANLAATQAGVNLVPPSVQVKNSKGEWETVMPQMGFPAGLPKTMTVDLTGKFLCDDSQVRIVTSMRIYWDQILVDTSDGTSPVKTTTLEPLRAELRWRGFPREYSPDGRKPLIYDYNVIEPSAPWKAHLGNYTKFGDVRELLLAPDDMYVITRSGDEMQVDFDASQLPRLPKGWKRTFLVDTDGFGKDMDRASARPDTIGELPFHGMKSYPYSLTDRYPMSKKHQDYLQRYNTRTVNEQLRSSWQGIK